MEAKVQVDAPVVQMVVDLVVVTIPHLLHAQLVVMDVELLVATIPLPLPARLVAMDVALHVVTIPRHRVQIVQRNALRHVRVKPRKPVQIARLDVVPVVATIVTTAVVDSAEESAGHRVVVHVKGNVDMVVAKWSVSDMVS